MPGFISCYNWHLRFIISVGLFGQNVILLLPKIFLNVVCASNLKNKHIIGNAFLIDFLNHALAKEIWF